jgi:hypothetical protein
MEVKELSFRQLLGRVTNPEANPLTPEEQHDALKVLVRRIAAHEKKMGWTDIDHIERGVTKYDF